ncbi:MAG: hypothetical protein JWO30_4497 [Fibrobacteres bacterium]|nr:hypothetical protein [Fibrobacterota bacterium]
MTTHKTAARIFGIFFIIAFAAYGTGSGLVDSIANAPGNLANVYANKTQLITGAILMALVHTFVNIGLAVIMLPILKPYNKNLAYGYFSAAIVATVVLVFGAIYLLLLIPLSDEFVKAGSAITPYFETLSIVLKKGGYFSYQIAMAIWGLGGLMFCYLLNLSRLVPRPIALWGFIGYIIFISGTIFELYGFGHNIGLLLDIPGGVFEIFLSVWLIVKGFNPSAFASTPAKTAD